jgi:hypothetical protein
MYQKAENDEYKFKDCIQKRLIKKAAVSGF